MTFTTSRDIGSELSIPARYGETNPFLVLT